VGELRDWIPAAEFALGERTRFCPLFLGARVVAFPRPVRRANVRDPSDQRLGAGLDPDFMATVHHVLETEVLKPRCSATGVAHLFTIDRRTLTRRLNAQGTAYRQVANAVRFEIARQLLAEPDMTVAQVAAMLKFSEPGAFTRAFRRWSGGQTPSAWRAQHCKRPAR
jgi:AraC-like DNA-binding protein